MRCGLFPRARHIQERVQVAGNASRRLRQADGGSDAGKLDRDDRPAAGGARDAMLTPMGLDQPLGRRQTRGPIPELSS